MADTPQEIVERELREFKRYTGDGLPGEPVNAPLPVGDPQSGVHNPKKVNLRKAMLAPLEAAAQSASDAKDEADRAEGEADRADAAADRAENSASSFIEVATNFKTVATLLADETMGYAGSGKDVIVGEGDIITAQGFRYEVAASDAGDAHIETAGGVKLNVAGTTIRPEMLGVVGDGIVDDTALFRKSLEISNERNGVLLGDPAARYRITENIEINRAGKTGLLVDLQGATLVLDEGSIWFGGDEPSLVTTLAADVAIGDSYLTLTDVTSLSSGDLLVIDSPAISVGAVNTVHAYLVNYIEGNDVWIVGTVVADITQQQIIDSGKAGDIAVSAYKLAPGLVIQNMKVEHVDTLGLNTGILIKQQFAPRLQNIICDGNTRNQIYIQFGSHDIVENCVFTRMGYTDEKEPTYTNRPSSPDGLSFGYGLIHARNYFSEVKNCSGSQGWHVFDAARGQMHINYIDCSGFRCAYSFSTHECAWHVNYINCENHGDAGWQAARAVHLYMDGCKQIAPTSDSTYNAILLGGSTVTVTIKNCELKKSSSSWVAGAIYVDPAPAQPGVLSLGQERVWLAKNNIFSGRCRVNFGADDVLTIMEGNRYQDEAYVYDARLPTHKFGAICGLTRVGRMRGNCRRACRIVWPRL